MRRRLSALTGPILVSLFASACDCPVGRADEARVPRDDQPASFDEIVADTKSLAARLELKHSLRIRKESPLSSYLGRRIPSDRGPWVLVEFTYTQSGEHAFILVRREKAGDGFMVATNYRPQKLGPDDNDVNSGKWDEDFVYEYDVSLNEKIEDIVKYLGEKKTLVTSWGNSNVMDGQSWLLSDGGGSRIYFYGYRVPWPDEEGRVWITDNGPPPGESRRQSGGSA